MGRFWTSACRGSIAALAESRLAVVLSPAEKMHDQKICLEFGVFGEETGSEG